MAKEKLGEVRRSDIKRLIQRYKPKKMTIEDIL